MIRREQLERILVSPDCPIREAMQRIDASGLGIVLITDQGRRLLGTITDGDVRRAILASVDLQASVRTLLGASGRPTPLTAPDGTTPEEMVRQMRQAGVRHLPIVEDNGRVVDLALLGDVESDMSIPVTAVVMAGGFGTRLRPLTEGTPKPLLPIGEKPLLHLIMDQLREAGVRKVHVTTHYKGDQISRYLGNGEAFGLDVVCAPEDRPLGTAGSLGFIEPTDEPLLVVNGDILTRLDFRHFVTFHREHRADMTVAVRRYEFQVPYGVVEAEGVHVVGISEKPTVGFFVNAGMYLLDRDILALVARGEHCDMPDLIKKALAKRLRVITFPVHEYWLDVGQLEDYRTACEDVQAGRV
jgi:dTDP-glucose pyrophosphorylase/CBS domain-containing protein